MELASKIYKTSRVIRVIKKPYFLPAFQKWLNTFMLNFSHVGKPHVVYAFQCILTDRTSQGSKGIVFKST